MSNWQRRVEDVAALVFSVGVLLTIAWAVLDVVVARVLTRTARRHGPERTLRLAERLSRWSVVQRSGELQFSVRFAAANANREIGQLAVAAIDLDWCAAATAERPRYPLLRGRFDAAVSVRILLAVTLVLSGRLAEAAQRAQDALDRVPSIDVAKQIGVTKLLAGTELVRGRAERAEQLARQALDDARAAGKWSEVAGAHTILGQVAVEAQDWSAARALLLRAVEESGRADEADPRQTAPPLGPAAAPTRNRRKEEPALLDLMVRLQLLAVACAEGGWVDDALVWSAKAAEVEANATARAPLPRRLAVQRRIHEAAAARWSGRPADALDRARLVLDDLTEDEVLARIDALFEVARAARSLGDPSTARSAYDEALASAAACGAVFEVARARRERDAIDPIEPTDPADGPG